MALCCWSQTPQSWQTPWPLQPREGDRSLCIWSSSPPGAPCGSEARCPSGDLLLENPALPFPGYLLLCPEDAPGFTFQENHIKGRKEGNPSMASLRVLGGDRPPSASGKMQGLDDALCFVPVKEHKQWSRASDQLQMERNLLITSHFNFLNAYSNGGLGFLIFTFLNSAVSYFCFIKSELRRSQCLTGNSTYWNTTPHPQGSAALQPCWDPRGLRAGWSGESRLCQSKTTK